MGDIFREIDEELRHDRYEKLWRIYGKYVIGLALAVVLSVGGYKGWVHYQTTQREAFSVRYEAAAGLLRDGRNQEAAALFAELGNDGNSGYSALSRFQQAALRADGGDAAGAVELYEAIAADSGVSDMLRDGAAVFGVMHSIDAADADAAALRRTLEPLMDANGAWRQMARELVGVLALRSGDNQDARKQFQMIADDLAAPQAMRARAIEILAVIGN